MRLEQLVGQAQATAILQRGIAARRVPHAYLFEGPPGVGKRSAAVALAMALNCDAPSKNPDHDGSACGTCDACRRIEAGLHPDVVTYSPDGTQILMEQAQEIVTLGQRRPHEAHVRLIIVDEADRLNANAANCLLKTLEEPLAGNHLVLVTTAPDRLLPTIRSRTQRVRFGRISVATLLELGAARGIDRGRAEVAAVLADGSAARFLELASDTDDQATRVATGVLRGAARASGIAPILDAAVAIGDKESKHRLPDVLALLGRVYRDALVTVAGASELAVLGRGGESGDDRDRLMIPTGLSVPALGRALAAIVDAEAAVAGNVNPVMAIERLLLNLRREERMAS